MEVNKNPVYTGLVVRVSRSELLIWNPLHDLVVAQDHGIASKWPIGSWVEYRAIKEPSSFGRQTILECDFMAYDINRIRQQLEVNIAADRNGQELELVTSATGPIHDLESDDLVLITDANLGSLLCKTDSRLIDLLESGSEIPVKVAFILDYPGWSRWIVTEFDHESARTVVSKEEKRSEREGAVAEMREVHVDENDCTIQSVREDWDMNCFERISDDKYEDVYGICIGHEEAMESSHDLSNIMTTHSLIATRFGLAKQPTNLPFGAWVKATIERDRAGDGIFKVQRSEKVKPPIHTRVIAPADNGDFWGNFHSENGEYIILHATISLSSKNSTAAYSTYFNPFLGRVEDLEVPPIIPKNVRTAKYLVELGLVNGQNGSTGNDGYKWVVLSYHGVPNGNIFTVHLTHSVHPLDWGRRCDDIQSICVDRFYNQAEKITGGQSNSETNKIGTSTSVSASLSRKSKFSLSSASLAVTSRKNTDSNTIIDLEGSSTVSVCSTSRPKNEIEERKMRIQTELKLYERVERVENHKTRRLGLVVEKALDYAIVYTKNIGTAVALAINFPSLQEFDTLCNLGQWIYANFVPIERSVGLLFEYACLPKFEQTHQKAKVQTRINNGELEILVNCDFTAGNLSPLSKDQYGLSTSLGEVLVSKRFVEHNVLLEYVVNLWVQYTTGSHQLQRKRCWKIADDAQIISNEIPSEIGNNIGGASDLLELSSIFQSVYIESKTSQQESGTVEEGAKGEDESAAEFVVCSPEMGNNSVASEQFVPEPEQVPDSSQSAATHDGFSSLYQYALTFFGINEG